ncbi:hypothetical protein V8G54_031598, partial [Vigna mungo]
WFEAEVARDCRRKRRRIGEETPTLGRIERGDEWLLVAPVGCEVADDVWDGLRGPSRRLAVRNGGRRRSKESNSNLRMERDGMTSPAVDLMRHRFADVVRPG